MRNIGDLCSEIERLYGKKCKPKRLMCFVLGLPEMKSKNKEPDDVAQGNETMPKN